MDLVKRHIINMLFESRKKVGENILSLIKDNGYTKSAFARISDISRPTLDKLISGEIDNKATYTTHIQKILESQKVSETELLEYKTKYDSDTMPLLAFSDNHPEHYERKQETKEMFMLLDDIISLCEMYYK